MTEGLRLGNRYLNEERSSHRELWKSTWNSHLAQWISQGWNQLTLGSLPCFGDDEHKYRPSLTIQDRSPYWNMHGNPLQWSGSVQDCTSRGCPRHTEVSGVWHLCSTASCTTALVSFRHCWVSQHPTGARGRGKQRRLLGGVLGKPHPNYQKRNVCLPNHIWNIHFCFNVLGRKKKKKW